MDRNNKRLAVIIILAVLSLIVMIQNLDNTPIHFLFFSISMPLIVLIFLLLVVGFILGYAVGRSRGKEAKSNGSV